jgi:hypothetical protein
MSKLIAVRRLFLTCIVAIVAATVYGRSSERTILARSGIAISGHRYLLKRVRWTLRYSWRVVTSKPVGLAKAARGARSITSELNDDLNRKFGAIVVSGKNDSEVFSWVRKGVFALVTSVHYHGKYFTFIECAVFGKTGPGLPPMRNDPKSVPM